MSLNEIEIQGSSLSLKIFKTDIDDMKATFDRIMLEGELFDIENETPGFHDCDCDENVIRGFYSGIVPFEVEHLVEGKTTRTLFKRIESVEFIATSNRVFCDGKPGPTKGLSMALSGLTGCECNLVEFEFHQLHQLQERLNKLKNIVLTNSKEKEVRRARLAGNIEKYEDYNIIDPRNHGIDSVSGVVTTPLGSMRVSASRKGCIKLGVTRGMIINVDCLDWIINLILEEKRPEEPGLFNSGFETEV